MNEHQPADTTPDPDGDPSPAADSTPATAPGPARRIPVRYALTMLACALIVYSADQLTKWWVVSTMTEGQVTPVLPPLLSWRFFRNPGAAFSIGTDYTWVFTIIMVVVSVALLLQVRKVASRGWSVALGLVLGGALGNLTDRLLREPSFGQGHVVDFIALPNFAIFNIADSAVVSGVTLICILTLRGIGLDGRRDGEPAKPTGPTDPAKPTTPTDRPGPAQDRDDHGR